MNNYAIEICEDFYYMNDIVFKSIHIEILK
jgi:hypothetical protein